MLLGALPDEFLLTLNSLEILGIIYLAIAVSKLRSEISHIQGILEGQQLAEKKNKNE
jgi:hypothetical protein